MIPHKILGVSKFGMIEGFEKALLSRGIVADTEQLAAAQRLQKFYDALLAFKAARRTKLHKILISPKIPKGVWFWGGVGRGKSFLMDCFYSSVPYRRKRRVHFYAFMREIHELINSMRGTEDHLAQVAKKIAQESRLICFDEFHITNIADAMILGRLMRELFEAKVIFCITSNFPPDLLYPNGLHRERLFPAIDLLNQHLDVIRLDAGKDYRLSTLINSCLYFVPSTEKTFQEMDELFFQLAHGAGHKTELIIANRRFAVIKRAPGITWFDFRELCYKNRSESDFLELTVSFHTLLLSGVPRLSREMDDAARRLCWLIDILYDHRVKLILAAECEPYEIFSALRKSAEYERTASRLIEMRSHEYQASINNAS